LAKRSAIALATVISLLFLILLLPGIANTNSIYGHSGNIVNSGWFVSPPTIDGSITENEWTIEGESVLVQTQYKKLDARIVISAMNNDKHLFLNLQVFPPEDYEDYVIRAGNYRLVGLYIDANHDGVFNEGKDLVVVSYTQPDGQPFLRVYGSHPLFEQELKYAVGWTGTGWIYELRIPFTLDNGYTWSKAGSTLGMAVDWIIFEKRTGYNNSVYLNIEQIIAPTFATYYYKETEITYPGPKTTVPEKFLDVELASSNWNSATPEEIRNAASIYRQYAEKRVAAYGDIADGLSEGTDGRLLTEFADEAERLSEDLLPSPTADSIAYELVNEMINPTSLDLQADVARSLLSSFRLMKDAEFYARITTEPGGAYLKYYQPMIKDFEELSQLASVELQIWKDAESSGKLDTERLEDALASEAAAAQRVKESVAENISGLVSTFTQNGVPPITRDFSVTKGGDPIVFEIRVPNGIDFVIAEVEQLDPEIGFWTSKPEYEIEYPIVVAREVTYRQGKISPEQVTTLDLCQCKDNWFNSGADFYFIGKTIHIKLVPNDLGGASWWGWFGGGPEEGHVRISYEFQDDNKFTLTQDHIEKLNSIEKETVKMLNEHIIEMNNLNKLNNQ
jgi:hypothetical protein